MELQPTSEFRYAFKEGMKGTDVAALQINLDVPVDGVFGKETKRAVEEFQTSNKLTVDGIAGLDTQRALCRLKSGPRGKRFKLPNGMLISIINNESGFAVAAYSSHPSDSGYDLGVFQKSLPADATQSQIYHAYDIEAQATSTAENLRAIREQFANPWPVDSWYVTHLAAGRKERLAWQLAVLSHNWPVAAHNIWKYGFIFPENYERENLEADWIMVASTGSLHTAREWCVQYILRSTVYVQWT